jgi:hypothetical protein
MRKFILISALLLASASAQASEPRGLTLASNEEPTSVEKIESVKPEVAKVDVKLEASKPEATKPEVSKPETSKPETSKPETSKPRASRPAQKVHARTYQGHDGDEARARTIAARYGISW